MITSYRDQTEIAREALTKVVEASGEVTRPYVCVCDDTAERERENIVNVLPICVRKILWIEKFASAI